MVRYGKKRQNEKEQEKEKRGEKKEREKKKGQNRIGMPIFTIRQEHEANWQDNDFQCGNAGIVWASF